MARGKAPPDEPDPRVREFVSHLRRLVDRSGLSVAAVADRTGHSRASWARYLDGRLLAPRGAVVALAEVTGTETGLLTAMWEQAERAWSRTEGRREPAADPRQPSRGPSAHAANVATETSGAGGGGPHGSGTGVGPGSGTGSGTGFGAGPGVGSGTGFGAGPGAGSGIGSPTGSVPPRRPTAPAGPAGAPPPFPLPPRRRAVLIVTGVLGALFVIVAAVLLTDVGTDVGTDARGGTAAGPLTAAPGTAPSTTLPAGVKCTGAGCTGQDPEAMGCGGTSATTVSRTPFGVAGLLEVRHSRICGAAWARIAGSGPGDTLRITTGGADTSQDAVGQDATVGADPDAYSPMVAVTHAADATACVTRTSGARVCTGGR
ncbi:helix-turn-helix domain-containing protein [Streptomyces sp. NPDC057430]|uniref:helix-turn-helix domain-containing protein n=1 Tax=Streptomyces sp. NPDC057430 TaxID=3346131 RepID=UPI0036BFBB33